MNIKRNTRFYKGLKKLISVLLMLSMAVAMLPTVALGTAAASADTAVSVNSGTWSDAGNYDLSWLPATAANDYTAQVGQTHYQVQNYTAGTSFTIDTPAKLAGLAVLVNAKTCGTDNNGTNAAFLGCVFHITADIDLAGHDWVPIGKTFSNKFGGQLVGVDAEGQVTVKNMTVNGGTPDYSGGMGTPLGLIGTMTGGAVSNLKFENAVINAVGFRVGTVAGQFNNATVSNVTADTKITLTTDNASSVWDVCGGIVGCTYAGATVSDCIFTGTIDNAGDVSGGIVGVNQQALTVRDCAVVSSHISHGVSSDYNGNGGILGLARTSSSTASISGCYVSATLTSANIPVIGGIVGRVTEDKTVSISDCHFDGIIPSTGSQRGAFVGRLQSANITLTLSKCLNTGVAVYHRDMSEGNAFSWIGLSYMNDRTLTLNISDCYSAATIPYLAIAESTKATYKGMVDGTDIARYVEAHTSSENGKGEFLSYCSPCVSFYGMHGDDAKNALSALDFSESGKWLARDGMIPTLKCAKQVADNTYATADLSWFDATDLTGEKLIDDHHELLGLSKISKACTYGTCTFDVFMETYRVKVSRLLENRLATKLYSELLIGAYGALIGTKDTASVVGLYAQLGTEASSADHYSVRFVAQINGSDWASVRFEYIVSYTDDSGVEHSSQKATAEVTTCYEAIYVTENGESVKTEAPEGHYFAAFVLENIPKANGNTEVTVLASLTDKNGKTVCGDTAGATFNGSGECVSSFAQDKTPTVLDQGDGCTQLIYQNVDSVRYTAYLARLANAGWAEYTTNTVEDNEFATYVNGADVVNVSYMADLGRMDVIVDPRSQTALPSLHADTAGTLDTLFTQVGLWSDPSLDHTKVTTDQNGMSYVMRLCDGSFIVIDGGHGEAANGDYRSDAEALYEILKKQAPNESSIVIAAWIFTHAHGDHTGTFEQFAKTYAGNVTVEQFIFNFPNATGYDTRASVIGALNSEAFKNVPCVKAHVGQRFLIRNAEIEILCNYELISPVELDYAQNGYNDTGLVFSIEANGYKIMMLADCYGNEEAMLRTIYTAQTLKSDAVQLGHHGIDGIITDDIYKLIDADTVFWPSASYHYAGYVNQNTGIVYPKFLLWGVTSTDMRTTPWNKWTQADGVTVYLASDDVFVCKLSNGEITATRYETISAYLSSSAAE